VFGCRCFILNNGKDNPGKFDEKAGNGIFIGYSSTSYAYRVYNKRFMTMEESIHVDEINHTDQGSTKNMQKKSRTSLCRSWNPAQKKQPIDSAKQLVEILQQEELPKEWRIPRDLLVDKIIGQIYKGVSTCSDVSNYYKHMAFVSQIEPKSIEEALKDDKWVAAMHEHLHQFTRNDIWFLFPKSDQMNIIGCKWVFINKLDESGVITRNKARLVAKGYNQEEGIDYGETFAPIARLEAIRLLLFFACMNGFKLFQMDVKSAFLNGTINEEVYVEQPPDFEDHQHPNHVYKLKKALYGLKQAPRQWYERLNNFLLSNGYERGMIDKTLFIKKSNSEIILVQIYVDDIIFCATKDSLCEEFVAEGENL